MRTCTHCMLLLLPPRRRGHYRPSPAPRNAAPRCCAPAQRTGMLTRICTEGQTRALLMLRCWSSSPCWHVYAASGFFGGACIGSHHVHGCPACMYHMYAYLYFSLLQLQPSPCFSLVLIAPPALMPLPLVCLQGEFQRLLVLTISLLLVRQGASSAGRVSTRLHSGKKGATPHSRTALLLGACPCTLGV